MNAVYFGLGMLAGFTIIFIVGTAFAAGVSQGKGEDKDEVDTQHEPAPYPPFPADEDG